MSCETATGESLSRGERAWGKPCPEELIELRHKRQDGTSLVHVLWACGEVVEVEERIEVAEDRALSPAEAEALKAALDRREVPDRILEAVRGFARDKCERASFEVLAKHYEGELSESQMSSLRLEFDAAKKRCAEARFEMLGSDHDEEGRRRWWFISRGTVAYAWFGFWTPTCDNDRESPLPVCAL